MNKIASRHTPGPWTPHDSMGNIYGFVSTNDNNVWICTVHWSDRGTNKFVIVPNRDEMEANARLIAAAPEMYELLVEAKEILGQSNEAATHIKAIDVLFGRLI